MLKHDANWLNELHHSRLRRAHPYSRISAAGSEQFWTDAITSLSDHSYISAEIICPSAGCLQIQLNKFPVVWVELRKTENNQSFYAVSPNYEMSINKKY